MITTQISLIAFYAARMILGLLLVLSILTIAFFLERMWYFSRRFLKTDDPLLAELETAASMDELLALLKTRDADETRVVLKGLQSGSKLTPQIFTARVRAHLYPLKERWERFSAFLGSVGSNAPFIGLLGTVLGILKSFADLSLSITGGPQVVMSGIAEALIVTAAGLAVAIPAVVFYNVCKVKVKSGMNRVESMIELINSKALFS